MAAAATAPAATPCVELECRPWVNAVAGGVGVSLAKTLMAPVQRIVVMRQIRSGDVGGRSTPELVRLVMSEHGPNSRLPQRVLPFFRGNLTSVMQRVPYSAIQLVLYDRCKHFIVAATTTASDDVGRSGGGGGGGGVVDNLRPLLSKAVAGGFAATVAGSVCFPLEVIRTRLMSSDARYTKIVPTARAIWGECGGPRNFYRGLSASLSQRVPDIVINYTVYETVKYSMERDGYSRAASVIAGGSAAAVTSVAVTFPLDTAKRCMVMAGQGSATPYTSVVHCLSQIFKSDGVMGWYRGAGLEVARCVPQVVIMWFAIDYCRDALNSIM